MSDYRQLRVWQRAHRLVLSVYSATRTLPPAESFGLVAQMRRSAVSVAANLAEGCGRNSDREIARYARIGLGSATELEYYVQLCGDLDYLRKEEREPLSKELLAIRRMLGGLALALAGGNKPRNRKSKD